MYVYHCGKRLFVVNFVLRLKYEKFLVAVILNPDIAHCHCFSSKLKFNYFSSLINVQAIRMACKGHLFNRMSSCGDSCQGWLFLPVIVGFNAPVGAQREHEGHHHGPEELSEGRLVVEEDVGKALNGRQLGIVGEDVDAGVELLLRL